MTCRERLPEIRSFSRRPDLALRLGGDGFGESTTECVLDADGFNLLFDLMGLKVVSQEKLQETLALISTLVSPYDVKCEVDGVRVSFGLPLAP